MRVVASRYRYASQIRSSVRSGMRAALKIICALHAKQANGATDCIAVPRSRRFASVSALSFAAMLLVTSACSATPPAQGDQGEGHPLFAADQSLAWLAEDAGPLTIGVCYDPPIDRFEFPGPAIPSVTGGAPLEFLETSDDPKCDVVVDGSSVSELGNYTPVVEDPTCRIAYRSDDEVSLVRITATTSQDTPELSCLLRVALYAEGYSGALRADYGDLFIPVSKSSVFISRANITGPIVTEIPTEIARKCPGIENNYYDSARLQAFIRSEDCLAGIAK